MNYEWLFTEKENAPNSFIDDVDQYFLLSVSHLNKTTYENDCNNSTYNRRSRKYIVMTEAKRNYAKHRSNNSAIIFGHFTFIYMRTIFNDNILLKKLLKTLCSHIDEISQWECCVLMRLQFLFFSSKNLSSVLHMSVSLRMRIVHFMIYGFDVVSFSDW